MPDFFCAECNTVIQLPDENPPESCSVCGNISSMRRLFAHGETLGGCTVIKHLSAKGAISFYLAEQTAVKRQVVLKVLDTSIPAGANILGKFQESARKSVKYLHSGIVSVLNAGKENQFYYTITPCIQGKTLAALIQEGRRFTPEEALKTLQAPAEALQYIWNKQQFCHGRLTAENIIISTDGDTFLLNFWDQVEEYRNVTENDALFSAPECMQTKAEKVSADLYTFGVLLFYMVSGTLPWQTLTPEARNEAISANRSFLQFIPFIPGMTTLSPAMAAEFKSFLEKLVSPDPALRINDWGEYLDKVESLQNFFKAPPVLTLKKNEVKNALPVAPAIPLQEENRTEKSKKKEAGTGKKEIQKKAKETKQKKKKKKKSFAEKFFIVLLQILILAGGVYAGYFLLVRFPHLDGINATRGHIKATEEAWNNNLVRFPELREETKKYAKKLKVEKFFKEELKKLDEKYSLIEEDLKKASALRISYREASWDFFRNTNKNRIRFDKEEKKYISMPGFNAVSFRKEQNSLLQQLEDMNGCLAKTKQGSIYLEKLFDKEREYFSLIKTAFLAFCTQQEKIYSATAVKADEKTLQQSVTQNTPAQAVPETPKTIQKQKQKSASAQTSIAPEKTASVRKTVSPAQQTQVQGTEYMNRRFQLTKYKPYKDFYQLLGRIGIQYSSSCRGYTPYLFYKYEKFRKHLPELKQLLAETERMVNAGNIEQEKLILASVKTAFNNLCAYAGDPALEEYLSIANEYNRALNKCGLAINFVSAYCIVRYHYRKEVFDANRQELEKAMQKINKFFASPYTGHAILVPFFATEKRNHNNRNIAYERFIRQDIHNPVQEKLARLSESLFNAGRKCRIYYTTYHRSGNKYTMTCMKERKFNIHTFQQNKDAHKKALEDLVELYKGKYDISKELQTAFQKDAAYYSARLEAFKKFCNDVEKTEHPTPKKAEVQQPSRTEEVQQPPRTVSRSGSSPSRINWQAFSGEERLEQFKKLCHNRLHVACVMFLNTYPLQLHKYQNGRYIRNNSFQRMQILLPEELQNDQECQKVQKDTNSVLAVFARLQDQAMQFHSLIGSTGKRYSGMPLYWRQRRCSLASMEGNFAVLFGGNRVPVQALGRYNLIQIIKYASSCNANVKKHALAFLLKLCAFDEAEGFAASVSERRIVTLLKNRYPREMRSSFLVYPLRNEIHNLPERMTVKSRKELEALEEAIRTNRQRSSTLSGSRNNNHRQ